MVVMVGGFGLWWSVCGGGLFWGVCGGLGDGVCVPIVRRTHARCPGPAHLPACLPACLLFKQSCWRQVASRLFARRVWPPHLQVLSLAARVF